MFKVAPEAEVAGVEIQRPGQPVQTMDRLSAQHPVLGLVVQVAHVQAGDEAGGAILLPPEVVQVSTIPGSQLGQHSSRLQDFNRA